MTAALIDSYDAALLDLDGVVYRGPAAVPGASQTIGQLRAQGTRVGFVTNNAARSPEQVAAHLRELGIACDANDVVTSAQAIAGLMRYQLGPSARVRVFGSQALADEVAAVGLTVTTSQPDAIVVGFSDQLRWADLNEACFAVQAGARWFASNDDLTRPTDQGMAIGMGGMLQAMSIALPGRQPVLAGKPQRPLLDATIERLGTSSPLFVGDRLDTDIEGAAVVGIDSLFVLSGSHQAHHLLHAVPAQRPTWIGADLAALLEPGRAPHRQQDGGWVCGPVTATVSNSQLTLVGPLTSTDLLLDALRAAAAASWEASDAGVDVDLSVALSDLAPLVGQTPGRL